MNDSVLTVDELVDALARKIFDSQLDFQTVVLLGIVTRGYPTAQRLCLKLKKLTGLDIPVGKLDITLYRDDLEMKGAGVSIRETLIPESLENRVVILVDDVLFHGRTVRAAIDLVLDYGRPASIKLAVLIDRGHREFPIAADYTGITIPTSETDTVKVQLREIDTKDGLIITHG